MAWVGPEPRVARCHASRKANSKTIETIAARKLSEPIMDARRPASYRPCRLGVVKLPNRRASRLRSSCGFLDLEALEVLFGLRRIEGLAHDHEWLVATRRRAEAHIFHQFRGVGGQKDLFGHRFVVDIAFDLSPALHLRQDPYGERIPGERIEIDALGIGLHIAESIGIDAGEALLDDGLGLIEIVGGGNPLRAL